MMEKIYSSTFFSLILFFLIVGGPSYGQDHESTATDLLSEDDGSEIKNAVSNQWVKRFLVADTKSSSTRRNPKIDYHPAGNHETIVDLSESWEQHFNEGTVLGVMKDHEGFLRMYYQVRGLKDTPKEGKSGVALIISRDGGKTWKKPVLGNLNKAVIDHHDSNLIDIEYDEEIHHSKENVTARAIAYHDGMYAMISGEHNRAYGFTSKDGIYWKKSGYIGNIRTDGAWNLFYDTIEEEWKIYGRIRGRSNWQDVIGYNVYDGENNPNPTTRRGVSLSRSKNFTDSPWEELNILVLDPQDYWDGWNNLNDMGMPTGLTPDFYVGSIYEYYGQYIGFPPTFFQNRNRLNPYRENDRVKNPDDFLDVEINRRWDGPVFPVLVMSRNGRDFQIPFKFQSAINKTPYVRVSLDEHTTQDPEKPEVGQLQSTRMIIVDDEIQLYFLHRKDSHYEKWGILDRSLERATIKLDRFASVGKNEVWLSESVTVPEDATYIRVNSSGDISVRIRNSQAGEGDIIPGFSYKDSIVPEIDSVNHLIEWKNGKSIKELRRQPIRVEVLPHSNGRFYGFSFTNEENHAKEDDKSEVYREQVQLSKDKRMAVYNAEGKQVAAKPLHEPLKGDPWIYILGVIEWEGKYRIYVGNRETEVPIYMESEDLETWSAPKKSDIQGHVFMFQHNGEVYGYKEMHNGVEGMHLYRDFDGNKFNEYMGKAYDWKIDGSVSMHFSDSGYFRAFGRVRGNDTPVNEGGWGGMVPKYPKSPFDDRRGISYHASQSFSPNWETNRQLVDPADIFEGYHKKDINFVPDFYDPNVMFDGKAFPTVFWKQKSRQVDRGPDMVESRRFRLTGEIYPVPAKYENGKMEFNFDYGSIIPKNFHEERAGKMGYHTVRDSNKMEIGEIYMAPTRVEKDGYVYMFYKYRSLHHYEGVDAEKSSSGVYSYRMKKDDFNQMFAF